MRAAVRRGDRPGRQPAAAGAGRAGQPVPGPAGRRARLVALPPPVRRPAPRPPPAAAARPGGGAAPGRGRLVRGGMGWSTTPSATRWPPATPAGRPGWSSSTSRRVLRRAARTRPCGGGWRRCRPRWCGSRPRLCLAQAFWALIGGRVEAAGAAAGRGRARVRATPPTSRTSRRSAGRRACWRTSRRRSPRLRPASPTSAATPSRRSRSPAGPWPSWTRANGCWSLVYPLAAGRWPSGCAAGRRRPSAAFAVQPRRAGGRPAQRDPGRVRATTTWATSSAPRAAWARRWAPTSRRWRSAAGARPSQPCRLPASPMWAWRRCTTNATSWTPPCEHATEGVAAVPGSSATPCRWPPAWPPWPGSARPRATRPPPWRRSTRPSRSRPARRWSACSTPCRRSGRGWQLANGEVAAAARWVRQRGLAVRRRAELPPRA